MQGGPLIGSGTFGQVYADYENNRAIKHVAVARNYKHVDELIREVSLLLVLDHANVLHAHDVAVRADCVELVTPLYECNLKEYAKSAAPDCDARRVLFTDVAHGTCYLHSCHVMHRDLKPQNIFIKNHRAVIGDLGMASVSQASKLFFLVAPSGRCDDSTYICTRWYRAPELLFGCAYGTAIDMWALGCVLAELITGVVLFAGKSTTNQLERILHNLECEQQRVAFDDVVHKTITLPPNVLRQASEVELSAIQKLMRVDPTTRMTAKELLVHYGEAVPTTTDVDVGTAVMTTVCTTVSKLLAVRKELRKEPRKRKRSS